MNTNETKDELRIEHHFEDYIRSHITVVFNRIHCYHENGGFLTKFDNDKIAVLITFELELKKIGTFDKNGDNTFVPWIDMRGGPGKAHYHHDNTKFAVDIIDNMIVKRFDYTSRNAVIELTDEAFGLILCLFAEKGITHL